MAGVLAGQPTASPYNLNSVRDSFRGTMWMANDGGIYRSTDGGMVWQLGSGLATLQPQSSFAGVALPGKPPALYMGVPDNDNFFSLDGGDTWGNPLPECGDCGPWFSDPAQPNRVLEFDRTAFDKNHIPSASWSLYVNPKSDAYPDPSNASHARFNRPLPLPFVDVTDAAGKGYKPIILTPINEDPLGDGDYILIRRIPTTIKEFRVLMRTTQLSAITSAADWSTKAIQQGPAFLDEMKDTNVVQASGGHSRPFFYVGDTKGLWRWTSGAPDWQRIVPAKDGTAKVARRFFVDPYNPSRIYIIDQDSIKHSESAGDTWRLDVSLDNAVTDNNSFSYDIIDLPISPIFGEGAVITDMVFDRFESGTRFAVGNAGVFFTMNGVNWKRLLSTTALPGHPVAAYFDRFNRALYVAMNGRGILSLFPIPPSP
jgi:hypothetical protein